MNSTMSLAAKLDNVVKRYDANTALDGVNLRIERGRVTALLGPNGAGKSTAISLLLGLIAPDIGHIELFGESPERLSARRRIGLMLQTAALPDTLRVRELLRLTASYYPSPQALAMTAAIAGIEHLLSRFHGRLSGGEKRRVQFALAICGNPELLFLDEPTTGLDIAAREALWSSIRTMVENGCTVLLTTHHLEEAEALAHEVVVLARGRVIAEGSVDMLRARNARQRIRCVSTISAEEVKTWPQVHTVFRENQWLNIEVAGAESIVRRLLNADAELNGLEVRQASLAEAFVQITKEVA